MAGWVLQARLFVFAPVAYPSLAASCPARADRPRPPWPRPLRRPRACALTSRRPRAATICRGTKLTPPPFLTTALRPRSSLRLVSSPFSPISPPCLPSSPCLAFRAASSVCLFSHSPHLHADAPALCPSSFLTSVQPPLVFCCCCCRSLWRI